MATTVHRLLPFGWPKYGHHFIFCPFPLWTQCGDQRAILAVDPHTPCTVFEAGSLVGHHYVRQTSWSSSFWGSYFCFPSCLMHATMIDPTTSELMCAGHLNRGPCVRMASVSLPTEPFPQLCLHIYVGKATTNYVIKCWLYLFWKPLGRMDSLDIKNAK